MNSGTFSDSVDDRWRLMRATRHGTYRLHLACSEGDKDLARPEATQRGTLRHALQVHRRPLKSGAFLWVSLWVATNCWINILKPFSYLRLLADAPPPAPGDSDQSSVIRVTDQSADHWLPQGGPSSVAEPLASNQTTRVRFPLPAPMPCLSHPGSDRCDAYNAPFV
jgi:hypothetical protein